MREKTDKLIALSADLSKVEKKISKHRVRPSEVFVRIEEYMGGAYLFDNCGFPMRKKEMQALIKLLEKGLASYSDEEEAQDIQDESDYYMEHVCISESKEPVVNTTPTGYVYVIKGESGRYKIGATRNVAERLKGLRVSSSESHELIFAYKVKDHYKHEKISHDAMNSKRVHSEWFDLTDDDVRAVKTYLLDVCIDKEEHK